MTDGLLLLHGWPLDGSMWDPQIVGLEDVAIIAPSMPGFGGTPVTAAVMTMDAAADAAADAVRNAGLDGAVVCGLSMGGYVALALWRRHRELFRGLILANTKSGPDDDAGRERRRALAERLRSEGNGFLAQSPPPLLSSDAPQELWDMVKASIRFQPAEAIAAAALGMAERPDSTSDLAGIDVPSLVITSSNDTLIPPEATSPIASDIPGARLEIIPNAGHLSNLEAPDAFNDLLRSHLAACGVAGRTT